MCLDSRPSRPVPPERQAPQQQSRPERQAQGTGSAATSAPQRGGGMRADHLLNFQRYDVRFLPACTTLYTGLAWCGSSCAGRGMQGVTV